MGKLLSFPTAGRTRSSRSPNHATAQAEIDADLAFRTACSQQVQVSEVLAYITAGLAHLGGCAETLNFLCTELTGCSLPMAMQRWEALALEAEGDPGPQGS